ncbi:MAG: hypothetical protein JNJ57_20700, partial [Saprospiraceae bacterium]|nr:hypothetical protein [Saprospiraceae bacterium]
MKIRTCRYLNLFFRHFSFLKTQLVLLPLLLANVTQAQLEVLNCATSEMMQARPDLLKKQEELDELVLKHNKKGATSESKATPYVLPVVVHIIHNNGVENISDGQIIAAIEHLNQAFAHEGYYAALGDGAITPVQFCLAKRDPDGNPTTGITRTESALTDVVMEFQDIQLKNLNRWNPANYVNIWVAREISSFWNGTGVAGYAFFPSSHGQQEDGIVCEASWFGVSQAKDAVLIHEMGHYLGLYHTFQGGCSNEDCTVQGDKVCDTPPDRAVHTDCTYNSCNTDEAAGSPFTSDQFDFTGDFMDYSPFSCYYFFTSGQAERMQATIETTRSSLLDSDGCLGTCDMVITADFSVQPNSPAVGQTVSFINNTMGATEFSWLDNGLEFSQDTNPSYVFSSVGTHIIRMIANNTDLDCIEKVSIQVEVQCPIQAGFTPNTTVALAGSTLVFTNTSSGAPNLSYEWRINDQVVSSSLNM